ncbi:hypothetical protein ABK040_015699 [Willaertia magna]
MSYYLNKIGYIDENVDDNYDDEEEYYNSEEEDEEYYNQEQDQQEEEELNNNHEEEQEEEEVTSGIDLLQLAITSKKKKEEEEKKKKEFKLITNKSKEEPLILIDNETDLPLTNQENEEENDNLNEKYILEHVDFKLNVLQCSKMFFEKMKSTHIYQYNYNQKYESEMQYLLKHKNEVRKQTGLQYRDDQELIDKNISAQRYTRTETKVKSTNNVNDILRHCFNRSDFCSTLNGNHLFIYGGRSGKQLQDDLVYFNLNNNQINIFKNLHYVSHNGQNAGNSVIIPPIVNSAMVLVGDSLFLFGGDCRLPIATIDNLTRPVLPNFYSYYSRPAEAYTGSEMVIFAITNVFNPDKMSYGIDCGIQGNIYGENYRRYSHPVRAVGSAIVPARSHFSIVDDSFNRSNASTDLNVYLFGGKANSTLDDFYRYTFTKNGRTFNVTKFEKPTKKEIANDDTLTWPTPRYDHSTCLVSNLLFIFGGYNNTTALNDLYMFDINTTRWTEIITESIPPPPLFKHQSFACNTQNFFVYGGRMNVKDQLVATNGLYRFDIVDKKWHIIEVISDEMNTASITTTVNTNNNASNSSPNIAEKDYSIYNPPLCGHTCYVYQNKMIRIGGVEVNDLSVDPFVQLWNLSEPGKAIPLCSYLKQKKEEGFLCDVVFRLKDKHNDFSYITAHKAIIKVRCPTLHEKILASTDTMEKHLLSIVDDNSDCNTVTLVDITECDATIFDIYLNFLYIAEINVNEKENVKSFLELVKLWSLEKHFPLIKKICLTNEQMDLSVTREILKQLHRDLCSLINDNTYSDLILVLDPPQANNNTEESVQEQELLLEGDEEFIPPMVDDENLLIEEEEKQIENGIAVHKLIMARSPFFSRMFVTSGMSESIEKVVHLTDYSKEVMLEVLTFLYTDTLRLTARNCIGILIYCLMFDLTEISNCCRRMICSLLDETNVWSIIDIALLYNDKILESECESYILKRYDQLHTCFGFSNLPDTLRIKIKQQYEKRNKHRKH